MAVSKSNFFKDHYDWFVALAGVALLAVVGYLYATSPENCSLEEARATCKAELEENYKPVHGDVPSVEEKVNLLQAVESGFTNPAVLAPTSDVEGSFLASEYRVRCKECRKPIPFKSKVCTWSDCRKEQPSENPEDLERKGSDLDGDGLPDVWETKYGLDPKNPADANDDADGDKFSNLEEFTAKTNPKDPEDHPDYLNYLTLAGDLRTENLPFWFKGGMNTPNGFRVNFVVTDGLYRKNVYAAKDEEIVFTLAKPKNWKEDKAPSGWRVVGFTQKTERRKRDGAGQEVERDASTVDLERTSDKHRITVKVNENPVRIEEQIDLHWDRGNESKTFTVTKGTVFKLNTREYQVKSLRKGSVAVIDLKTDTRKTIGDGSAGTNSPATPSSPSKPKPAPRPTQQGKRKP